MFGFDVFWLACLSAAGWRILNSSMHSYSHTLSCVLFICAVRILLNQAFPNLTAQSKPQQEGASKKGSKNASETWGDSGLQYWEISAQGDVRPRENKQENLQTVTFQAVCPNTTATLSNATHWHPSTDGLHATKQSNNRRDPETLSNTL